MVSQVAGRMGGKVTHNMCRARDNEPEADSMGRRHLMKGNWKPRYRDKLLRSNLQLVLMFLKTVANVKKGISWSS